MKTVKVKYLKSHPKDAYFAGNIAEISDEKAALRLNSGHVMILPDDGDDDDDDKNPLPSDLPGRELLFKAKFLTVEAVKQAGNSVLDVEGIGKGTLKQLKKYFGTDNELPEDLPGRDLLFKAGFDSVEKVKDATREEIEEVEGLTEEVIAELKGYFEEKE